ncbi:hypothetical protein [Prevotella sp. OH937_COT-195]|uniref:hypothetical protein n=1 Tax=Prevotella sp. OH937_COT-195 TaxID=2491051 RepID=UPI000F6496FF|nr:hypothetical protein [Prevotella sp. OH937_COT-195]RRC99129.1 hypothetical protein EII32_08320 [Prevotella sp. OH937_COT-195]
MRYNKSHFFNIAELDIKITFKDSEYNSIKLLSSFAPFEIVEESRKIFFHLIVDDDLQPIKEGVERIDCFDTGNGDTIVDKLPEGGYQYIIKDIKKKECCLLQTNKDFTSCHCALNGTYNMRCFGLNNALMLIFAFAGSHVNTILIHASLVRNAGKGYAFIAKSGTGKSTQVSNWLRYIPHCDLMNDDNPIIRILDDGKPYIYGSPWSGKTPCYRNVKAPLGAIARIDRAKINSIERERPVQAFASLLPSCSSMKWDKEIFNNVCNIITRIIETTKIYILHCLPDKESAILCHKEISK